MKHELINREISWLDFNARVLQEAADTTNPLIERFRFLGIFSNNKDEFFRVRMATLHRLLNHKKASEDDKKLIKNLIKQANGIISQQEEEFGKIYDALILEAQKENIFLLDETQLNKAQEQYIQDYFEETVRPHIFPLMLDSMHFNQFKDNCIYLVIAMSQHKDNKKNNIAIVEIPSDELGRFVHIPSQQINSDTLMFLDDIIKYNLRSLFKPLGYNSFEAYIIKFTREAELDIDNDVMKSFMKVLSDSVKKRKKAPHIRFVYDKKMPEELLEKVFKAFGISNRDRIKASGKYHKLRDFMDFPIQRKELMYKPIEPQSHPAFKQNDNKFEILKQKDVLLYFPYHSFQDINDWIWEASFDPQVRSIKMTFYRVSRKSKLMLALINAARNGKKVTVFMELQARFDEEDNIYWSKRLQAEGAVVIPTIPEFKVHAKLMLIRRKENGENVYYGNMSTGNFHESTAKVYADFNLLTANQTICKDIDNVFTLFQSKFVFPPFTQLIVAPFAIRHFLNEKIEHEIALAKAGKQAYITIKINSLVDKPIIDKIYEAADAGVSIKLLVRGICVLKKSFEHPNIEAFGIVDRFLEHSRVFIFGNDGKAEYYLSSADIMPRNLDRRIEVICPVHDSQNTNIIQKIIDFQMQDNVKTRWLQGKRLNNYRNSDEPIKHRSQEEIYYYLFGK